MWTMLTLSRQPARPLVGPYRRPTSLVRWETRTSMSCLGPLGRPLLLYLERSSIWVMISARLGAGRAFRSRGVRSRKRLSLYAILTFQVLDQLSLLSTAHKFTYFSSCIYLLSVYLLILSIIVASCSSLFHNGSVCVYKTLECHGNLVLYML